MSDDELINPAGIPRFTGNLETLETDSAALITQAGHFRSSGASVNSEFQGLSAFYKAPEADQLFATTIPVATKSDAFADDLEKVSAALSAYGGEVRPIVARLQSLRNEAWSFVQSIEDDGDWREDKKKVQHNNDLWHDVNATLEAFWAAERSCYGKITALVGGAPLIPDDGTHKQNMYGYTADDLDHAEETPWGSTTDREYTGLAWLGHQAKSYVWDGFIVDGVWGTIKGLGTLVGTDGWDSAGKAWTGLAKLATGLAIVITPFVGTFYMAVPEDKLPGWFRDSRTALTETGKALIAYDEWGKNPARAAGAVTFNVITAIFTEGAGSATKSGAVAKTLSVLGKTGRALDPMTYVIAGGKFAVVKVGDLLSGLKNLRTGVLFDTAAAGYRLPDLDDALTPPPAGLPENTVRLINHEGKTVYLDADKGTLFNESGEVMQRAEDVKVEPSAAERAAEQNPLPHREPALVGAHTGDTSVVAGAGAIDVTARVGGDRLPGAAARHLPGGGTGSAPHGGVGDNLSGGRSDDLRGSPSASHGHPGGGATDSLPGRPHGPSTGGPGDLGRAGDEAVGDAGHVGDDATPPASQADEGVGTGDHGNGEHRELTPAELKRIQDEHIRKANDPDRTWFEKYYDIRGHRLDATAKESGATLPILKKLPDGSWIAKYDMPHGPSEIKYGSKPLGPDTFPGGKNMRDLDTAAENRKLSVDLTNATKAFDEHPSAATERDLTAAQEAYTKKLGDLPNNSKFSETLGEQAAALHVIPHQFPKATLIKLPKAPNGANMFDLVYKNGDNGERLIVEAKAPSGELDWRDGRADPVDPANPHIGDDGGAQGMRVKQGTKPYIRTILAEMTARGGRDAEIAAELRTALKDGKLKFVLVKAKSPNGSAYGGATLEYFKI
ncbi:hypothetical protein G3I60_32965 [Streptomyces sp. SID13666]|uniref:hypothetical protein n=1 Tax=unclassified Streptomyces TaxID=2593676 RepID=UPI0013BF4093|nr:MULTISPECIES: hypothetical protein [unclassified Streptomyces]NEA58840.1 hypothetical protein [Streptomyces sp. SID13666]NEA74530.1 hypothetical protein [Streptomyces sp. SID13588]